MSFIDHLEELRWHIIRSLIALVVASVAAFFFKELIFHDIILGPSRINFPTYRAMCDLAAYFNTPELCIDKLSFIIQSRKLAGQFNMHLTASFTAGFIVTFPYAFWEIWRFVKPGLRRKERRKTTGAVLFVSTLFMIGVLFGYYVVAPLSINFLANYTVDPGIVNQFDITDYISTLSAIVLGCALLFQLPAIVYFLSKIGVVTPEWMRKYRRFAIVGIIITSAIITPGSDLISLALVALPLYFLYELSIFLSAFVQRRQSKEEGAERSEPLE